LNCTQSRPAAHTNLNEYFENEHLESWSQVLPADKLMANEYLWSQVTMGEYLVEIVQYFEHLFEVTLHRCVHFLDAIPDRLATRNFQIGPGRRMVSVLQKRNKLSLFDLVKWLITGHNPLREER
jgi:hypothetical protein